MAVSFCLVGKCCTPFLWLWHLKFVSRLGCLGSNGANNRCWWRSTFQAFVSRVGSGHFPFGAIRRKDWFYLMIGKLLLFLEPYCKFVTRAGNGGPCSCRKMENLQYCFIYGYTLLYCRIVYVCVFMTCSTSCCLRHSWSHDIYVCSTTYAEAKAGQHSPRELWLSEACLMPTFFLYVEDRRRFFRIAAALHGIPLSLRIIYFEIVE
jgi:hypothetical protein